MSGTARLVGRAVEGVMKDHAARFASVGQGAMTIRQVSDACEISKPTARKYMDILVDAGLVRRDAHPAPNGFYYTYEFTGE